MSRRLRRRDHPRGAQGQASHILYSATGSAAANGALRRRGVLAVWSAHQKHKLRDPDGTLHQKAFAGQTFDRTVHKGDLTGIEIINRLAEQVWARGIHRLEEHRAIDLVANTAGDALAGVLMMDIRSGDFVFVQAQAVLLDRTEKAPAR